MGCCTHRREGPVRCGTLPSPSVIRTPDRELLLVVRPKRASADDRLRRASVVRSGRELGAGGDARMSKAVAVLPPVSRIGRCSCSSNPECGE
jgi:hypothetical protein